MTPKLIPEMLSKMQPGALAMFLLDNAVKCELKRENENTITLDGVVAITPTQFNGDTDYEILILPKNFNTLNADEVKDILDNTFPEYIVTPRDNALWKKYKSLYDLLDAVTPKYRKPKKSVPHKNLDDELAKRKKSYQRYFVAYCAGILLMYGVFYTGLTVTQNRFKKNMQESYDKFQKQIQQIDTVTYNAIQKTK